MEGISGNVSSQNMEVINNNKSDIKVTNNVSYQCLKQITKAVS